MFVWFGWLVFFFNSSWLNLALKMWWIPGKLIFQGKEVHWCLMQGVRWETERGVSVKLEFIYRSILKLQKIQSCCAESVKKNIAVYQHGSSEGITDLTFIHKALTIVPEGQNRNEKQTNYSNTYINQGAYIPFSRESGRKTPSNGLRPRL